MRRRNTKPLWRSGADFRIVCDCQRHRAGSQWRRGVRAIVRKVGSIRRHGLTLLVGVPLALGVLEPVGQAGMSPVKNSVNGVPSIAVPVAQSDLVGTPGGTTMPVFTTPAIREQFLNPSSAPQRFSIERSKEEFFRAQIPYGSIIYREAKRNQLPPELVAAVVHTESDFRVRLVSNKNAHGLMQLIPSTGKLMGAEDLFNPEQNVAAGSKYLRQLMDRFGDQRLALAAYNAGASNVVRFGGVPPFPETQNYVKRVDRRMARYRERFETVYTTSLRVHRAPR